MKNLVGSKSVVGRSVEACAVALSSVLLSACGATDEGLSGAEDLGDVQEALVSDGYWQVANGPEVYRLHGGSICWVRDQGMLMALRWTTTPQWTPSGYSFAQLSSGRLNQGACHYPDYAILKTYDSRWVYRMVPGGFCHVKNLTQLEKFGGWSEVLVMQRPRQSADYSEGGGMGAEGVWYSGGARIYSGDCQDPVLP